MLGLKLIQVNKRGYRFNVTTYFLPDDMVKYALPKVSPVAMTIAI